MLNLHLGMKIYDNAWFLRHHLAPEAAADLLAGLGVTFVITQSRFLPMQDSAVESRVREGQAAEYAALDDLAFRAALAARGIGYFACLNIGFDPALAAAHPDLVPVDQFGRRAPLLDWYQGIPPDRALNLEHKIALLEKAVAALAPDGVHLGFVRWPGFWETWLPDIERGWMPEYCYAPETLRRFCAAAGVEVPVNNAALAARLIDRHHRRAWRDWKCTVTAQAIGTIGQAVRRLRPDTAIAINTLPFLPGDFGNAVEEVFGQDIQRLADVVDVFEVMSYHQILGRDGRWVAAVGADIKARAGRSVVCTIQAKPYYLDGLHAGRGRSEQLSAAEFGGTLDLLAGSTVDGGCVFTFSDLLDERGTPEGRQKWAHLARFGQEMGRR